MSRFGKALAAVAPSWARRRAENRLACAEADFRLDAFNRINRDFQNVRVGATAHDAARRTRLEADWPAELFSADGALLPEAYTLVARARDAKRNYWAARSAADAYRRHVVGTGITCRSSVRDPITKKEIPELNEQIDRLWNSWCNDKWRCDIEGKKTFLEIQGLMIEDWFTVGESFLVETIHPDTGQFCVAVYESEQLARDHEIPFTPNTVKSGIEQDRYGRPIAYYFHTGEHPLERFDPRPVRIPANRVHHLFRQERTRQSRGITRMVSILRDMRHLRMYDEYQIVRARIEACIALLIKRDNASSSGSGFSGTIPGVGAATSDEQGNDIFDLQPGLVARLGVGESFDAFDPKAPGTTYEPFSNHKMKQISAGSGLDYPTVARDFTNGSFSSQREGHIERDKETDPLQTMLRDTAIITTRRSFVAWTVATGQLVVPDWFMLERYADYAFACDVQPPPKPWIDPAKQAVAAKIAIENLLSSPQIEANTLGLDIRELMRMKKDIIDLAADLGITVPYYETKPAASPSEPRPSYGTDPNADTGEVRANGSKLGTNGHAKHARFQI